MSHPLIEGLLNRNFWIEVVFRRLARHPALFAVETDAWSVFNWSTLTSSLRASAEQCSSGTPISRSYSSV